MQIVVLIIAAYFDRADVLACHLQAAGVAVNDPEHLDGDILQALRGDTGCSKVLGVSVGVGRFVDPQITQ